MNTRKISLAECREVLRLNPLTPARVLELIKKGVSIVYWDHWQSCVCFDELGRFQIRIRAGMSLSEQELTLWRELVHLHLIDLCDATEANVLYSDHDDWEAWIDEIATQMQQKKMFEFYDLLALLKNNHLVL